VIEQLWRQHAMADVQAESSITLPLRFIEELVVGAALVCSHQASKGGNREMMSPHNSANGITVQIPTASGDAIEAWVYLPEGNGPHPAVVMAHGVGGIKAGGLAPFAERFRAEGFIAIAFDYRNFGGSGGQPREVWESVEAFRTAFGRPDFRSRLAQYPDSVVASPHLFEKVAVRGICVA
jgi:dipeptidyl aminopeptidase/acylaminoacyl peptidase